jgi:myosin heavy subunit
MGKVLRGLVIVILVLSIVALYFANELFKKRELLTKRNRVLVEEVVKLAKTIEAADAPDAAAPELQKDISEVSDRELANPEKESVLEGYAMKLEQPNLPTLDYDNDAKRLQLKSYFVLGPDGKYEMDPVDNTPKVKGPGSMQELLDQLFDRAKAQQTALNKTRSELTKMREQLSTSVADINKLKVDGRTTKKELTETKGQVAALQTEKETLEGRVAKLTAEKKELAAEAADAKAETERVKEENVTITEELASAKKTITEMKKKWSGGNTIAPTDGTPVVSTLSAGDKGKILEANDELKFVIIEFSGDAMVEMLGAERQNAMPQLDMNVRRIGRQSAAGEFVTRIKLRQAVRGKNLVVADILSDWQQVPVEKGDVVFF